MLTADKLSNLSLGCIIYKMDEGVIFLPHGVVVGISSEMGVKCLILSLAHSKGSENVNNDDDDNW